MASILLASGAAAANSADLIIAAGAKKTLKFVGAGTGYVHIQVKMQDGSYKSYATLDYVRKLRQIDGPITIRVSRPVLDSAAGVDEE